MQATSPVTVQQAQTNALLSMLNLNNPLEPSISNSFTSTKAAQALKVPTATGPPVWKILVLDQETKDILATVLRVQDLRDIGVTLHVYDYFPQRNGLKCLNLWQAAPFVPATAVRCSCHLLRCSDLCEYQKNIG